MTRLTAEARSILPAEEACGGSSCAHPVVHARVKGKTLHVQLQGSAGSADIDDRVASGATQKLIWRYFIRRYCPSLSSQETLHWSGSNIMTSLRMQALAGCLRKATLPARPDLAPKYPAAQQGSSQASLAAGGQL